MEVCHFEKKSFIRSRVSESEEIIILFLKQGLTNKEIAERLDLNENSIKNIIDEIFRKTGVSNKTKLFHLFSPVYQE